MVMATKKNSGTISSVIRSRLASFMGYSHEGTRDLYSSFGYPREVTIQELRAMYDRNDIAHRIVKAFPQATWRDVPVIRDERGNSSEAGTKSYSPFVEAVEKLFKRHRVMHFFDRADRLASIGRYGILVIGYRDGGELSEPLKTSNAPLSYLSPYSEDNVQVSTWDMDTKSERFGKPEVYNLTRQSLVSTPAPPMTALRVHWTRVIHLSEFLESDEVYGTPRLLPIYNRLKDLEKVVGGAAENYWLTANRGMMFSIDKEAQISQEDKDAMKAQAEEFQHQLRRYMIGQGLTATPMTGEDHDPGPTVDRLLDLISGAVGIPKRILIGSERGELSSAQDENNWSERIEERRENFASPAVIQPFINAMVSTGNLPKPEGEWWVEWGDVGALGAQAEAEIMERKTNALVSYAMAPGAEMIVPMQEFRKDFLGLEADSEYTTDIDEEPLPEDIDEPVEIDANARPRSMYVWRRVLNAPALKKWAKDQGFKNVEDDLHVTLMYCRKPVDWMTMGAVYKTPMSDDSSGGVMVDAGGPRVVEHLGTKGAIVLHFACHELTYRHQDMIMRGAEHSYPEYQPHITISHNEPGLDVDAIEPYTGAIALGPEEFFEISADGRRVKP
jgi:hypothetical protein